MCCGALLWCAVVSVVNGLWCAVGGVRWCMSSLADVFVIRLSVRSDGDGVSDEYVQDHGDGHHDDGKDAGKDTYVISQPRCSLFWQS